MMIDHREEGGEEGREGEKERWAWRACEGGAGGREREKAGGRNEERVKVRA